MKKYSVILFSLSLLVIAGCSDVGFKKTKSGLMYKIMSEGNNPQVKQGQWLKIHARQTVHDSLLGETYGQMPIYLMADSMMAAQGGHNPAEVFPLFHKGDSAVVVMFADTIFKRQGGLPDFIKRKDKIIITFKVLDVFSSDSAKIADETVESDKAQKKQMAETEVKRGEVVKEIESYLAEKKTTYQKTPGGTYVVITDPGTDPKADSGTIAFVKYKGTLYKTDRIFDQNMDGSRPPLQVKVGAPAGTPGSVVAGWNEGISLFGKGGKGVLYVPFWAGYGPMGPMNTPFATMVFDIEVTDVQTAPATPSPGAPPPPARN
jgi:FKBP-type peptidyl-prolyl cis-trans isomerase FkpA